jgi:hypothetical protein
MDNKRVILAVRVGFEPLCNLQVADSSSGTKV